METRIRDAERIEALRSIVSILTAADLTVPESRAARRQLVAVLGRADLDGEPKPAPPSWPTAHPPRAARRSPEAALCATC